MITVHVLLTVLITTHLPKFTDSKIGLRVYQGLDDITSKYPYVVSIQPLRSCTGSLLTANWVLTAAHCCIETAKLIQYGNMSTPLSLSDSTSKVLKRIRHPRYISGKFAPLDIGLMFVSPVAMNKYASISAVDYLTLTGVPVEYAGYGLTFLPKKKTKHVVQKILNSLRSPLQIGEVVISPCTCWFKGFICASPKCSITQLTTPGDSGGPLFMEHKIVGLVTGALDDNFECTDRFFTPISTHLSWINSVINYSRSEK
ncbi:unnamed protein product [Arctia plantaginis]|uniref:Peptidase S1 domain-containing protein n=1 Tax=Arctia plantaginis TaxID=874455 RepID=A0A8S1B1D6_ARCPL|nr:unnamed protein product [Arctia plantaginis]